MGRLKIRELTTNLPYSVKVTPIGSETILHSATGINDAEYEIPDFVSDSLTNFRVTTTGSQGNIHYQDIDAGTFKHLKKFHFGPSIANGNFENHLAAIAQAAANNCTYAGTVYEREDIQNDAALNALDSIVFDHTVAPAGGVYLKGFDEVVREAYLAGVALRVGLHQALEDTNLNNGSDRTLFYGDSALSKRPDGTNTYMEETGPVPSRMIPSYASSEFRAFSRNFVTKWFKRYLPAINDGTILCVGLLMGATGESEYVFSTRDADGNDMGASQGDFNAEMIAKFKARFTQFASKNNSEIANAASGSDLGLKYAWFLSDVMREYEWYIINSVIADVPGLTRSKWFQIDSGSFTDALTPRRRTFNLWERIHPATLVLKSNDNTGYSDNRLRFIAAFLASCVRKYGGIGIIEPSPMAGDFTPGGGNRPYIQSTININNEYGIGESFVNVEEEVVDWMISVGGLATIGVPNYINEFRTVNGKKVLNRFTYNLSSVLSAGDIQPMITAYYAYLSANGITQADIRLIDDIKPS
jgi:hypothetical protein